MKILVIEDEKLLADSLRTMLEAKGFEVETAYDGETGAEFAELGIYDLLILDVMMPKLNGYQLARQVRAKRCTTPILMLTAKSQLDDKVEGLDSGADDYLTKPFLTKELLARLRALGRRNLPTSDGSFTFGDLSLDVRSSVLKCENGQSVRLGEKELRILEYLIANQSQVLTREQIALKIWGYESDSEYNNVEVYLSFVRKKLAYVESRCEIKALRGIGYELRCRDVR